MSTLSRLAQVAAIAALVLINGAIIHKGYTDIAAIAQKHSGTKFAMEVARYFFGNIAGGGKRDSGS